MDFYTNRLRHQDSSIESQRSGPQQVQDGREKGLTDDPETRREDTVIDYENDFPEGSLRSWSVVLGAWLCLYPSYGFMVSIGVVQDYLHQNQLVHYTSGDVAWISGMFIYLAHALGIGIGPLFDQYGPRWIAIFGSTAYIAMVFLLAECQAYWQFMLCLGLLGGVAGAAVTTVSLACVSHWFKARRALAHGIAMSGSSFGGLTLPLILRSTLPLYGFAWSVRILGFLFLGCFIVGNSLMRARIPPSKEPKRRKLISFALFANMKFSLLTVAVFCFEFVLYGALGIVPTYATVSESFPRETGFYLISVLNGVSSVSRIVSGLYADRLGRFNTLGVSALVALLSMLVVWLPFGAQSLAALYIFITLFGICTGTWMSLIPPCLGQLCQAREFGRHYGSCYFLASISTLICIPISGQLIETASTQAMILFNCGILVFGCALFVLSRWACLGWRWKWTAKI